MLPGTPTPASPLSLDSKARGFSLAGFHIPTRLAGKFGSPPAGANPLEPPSLGRSPGTPAAKARKPAALVAADFSPTIMPNLHTQPQEEPAFRRAKTEGSSPSFVAAPAVSSPAANAGRVAGRPALQLVTGSDSPPCSPHYSLSPPSTRGGSSASCGGGGAGVEVMDCQARDLAREANEAVVCVGSVRFLVPYALLKRDPDSNFRRMLDGEWDDVARDEPDGSYTIAHSPFLFAELLQLLRGNWDLPFADDATLRRLLAEIDFYNLEELRQRFMQRYPRLSHEPLRYDGVYFAVNTPIAPHQPGQFDHVNPDNFFRAFKFYGSGKVVQYKAKRTWSETKVEHERTGTHSTQPDGAIGCSFGRDEHCLFTREGDALYLHLKDRISKVVFEPDEKLYTWLKLPVL